MRRMRTQVDMEGKSRNAVCSRGGLGPALVLTGPASSAYRTRLRQLREVGRNPSRLIFGEQLCGRLGILGMAIIAIRPVFMAHMI